MIAKSALKGNNAGSNWTRTSGLLVPKGQGTVFLTLCGDLRRFSLGERCSCALFFPLFPCVPDLSVVKYVVVIESQHSDWGAADKEKRLQDLDTILSVFVNNL